MFSRRNRNEGFEWHKYVRTVVKQRRELRRERVRQARHQAAQQAGAAGVALVAGSKAAGAAAWDGARAGAGAAGLGAQGLWHLLVAAVVTGARGAATAATVIGEKIAAASEPLRRLLAEPRVGGPVILVSAIAVGLGVGRARSTGLDAEAMMTLAAGVLLLLASLPMLSVATGLRIPSLHPGLAVGVVVAIAVASGLVWLAGNSKVRLPSVASQIPLVGGTPPLEGRARAVGGDLLRVGDTTVRLAGIEAPVPQARCGGNRRCGTGAETALGRLVNGRTVTCKLGGTDSSGRRVATCVRGDADIGAELVRKGHVFAEGGLFASYTGLEREARNAKAGIWSNGEPERPADYRARVAKRNS